MTYAVIAHVTLRIPRVAPSMTAANQPYRYRVHWMLVVPVPEVVVVSPPTPEAPPVISNVAGIFRRSNVVLPPLLNSLPAMMLPYTVLEEPMAMLPPI